MRRGWALLIVAMGCAPSLEFEVVREPIIDAASDVPRDSSLAPDASDVDRRQDATPDAPRDAGPDVARDAVPDTLREDAPAADAAVDSAPEDAGEDATSDATSHALSPLLSVPPADNPPCSWPGGHGDCPSVHACRFFDTESGRCDTCDECRGLDQFCETSFDCDIIFVCFDHRCTAPCLLGTYQCGPIEDCWNVGHPEYGVCAPL